jgi:hypothetical protein
MYYSSGVVRIATAYWLDGPGIESLWGRDFPHLFRPALRPTQFRVRTISLKGCGASGANADGP